MPSIFAMDLRLPLPSRSRKVLKTAPPAAAVLQNIVVILKKTCRIQTQRRRGAPAGHSPHLHDGAHAVVGTDPHDLAVATVEDGERRTHPLPLVACSIDGLVLGFAFLSVSVFTENRKAE